jgi:hypothetical protein
VLTKAARLRSPYIASGSRGKTNKADGGGMGQGGTVAVREQREVTEVVQVGEGVLEDE